MEALKHSFMRLGIKQSLLICLLSSCRLQLLCQTANFSDVGIYGKLIEGAEDGRRTKSSDPIIFADVLVYSNDSLISATQTDFDGNYLIRLNEIGEYTIEFWYLGFAPKRIEKLNIDTLIALNVALAYLPELPCCSCSPAYNFFGDGFSTGQTLDSQLIRHAAYR